MWNCIKSVGRSAVGVAALLCLACVNQIASAQPPAQWDIMRVYIDGDQESINKIVTDDYLLEIAEELETKLVAEAERRSALSAEPAGLREATYIVSLVDERLVSEQSLWQLSGPDAETSIELGQISIAPTRSRAKGEGQRQLVDFDAFDGAGQIQLEYAPDESKYCFGFSAVGNKTGGQQRFTLELPAAPIARMLVAVPDSLELFSTSASVEQVYAPEQYVADSVCRAAVENFRGPPSNWWLVMCSGLAQWDLQIREKSGPLAAGVTHMVKSSRVEYAISPVDIKVLGTFNLAPGSTGEPIAVRLQSNFRVQEVLVDNIPTPWRKVGPDEEAGYTIALSAAASSSQETQVVVRGLAGVVSEATTALPSCSIDDAYSLDGRTSVAATKSMMLVGLESHGKRLESAAVKGGVWSVNWIGKQPELVAQIAERDSSWHLSSLTRFALQPEWLSANCRARVENLLASTNELKFEIGTDWLVDSVRIVEPGGGTFQARVAQSEASLSSVVIVDWEGNPQSVAFELEVLAHSPRTTTDDRIGLAAQSLLTLPGADQVDNYAIEPSGRFRVRPNAGLLRLQQQPVDLPIWQRELLPRDSYRWLFRGVRGQVPTVNLVAYGGTFVANVTTALLQEGKDYFVNSTIKCQPISGSVDRLACILPAELDPEALAWSMNTSDAPNSSTPLGKFSAERGPDQTWLLEVELPAPMQEAFMVQVKHTVAPDENGQLHVGVLAVPRALSGGSTVLLPRAFSPPIGKTLMELLPKDWCCSGSEYDQILGGVPASQRATYLVGSLDASSPHSLVCQKQVSQSNSLAWVRNESVVHTLYDGDRLSHVASWLVEAAADTKFSVQLPADWKLQRLEVDGQDVGLLSNAQNVVEINLDAAERTLLRVVCSSPSGSPLRSWYSAYALSIPQVSAPVLRRQVLAQLPPTEVPLLNLGNPPADASLLDRLKPSVLWGRVTPSQTQTGDATQPRGSWSTFDLSNSFLQTAASANGQNGQPSSAPEVVVLRTVHRSGLAALAMALLAFGIAVLRLLAPKTPAVWLVLLTASAATVVLCPLVYLPLAQLLMLGTLCGFLLHVSLPILKYRRGANGTNGRGNSRLSNAPVVGAVVMGLLCGWPASVVAQTEAEVGANGTQDAASSVPRKIYSVLFPVNEDSEASSKLVYVPTELLELLNNPQAANQANTQPLIHSADYRVRIRRSPSTGISRATEFSLDMNIDFPSPQSVLQLPFLADELRLVGGQIDGQEVGTGGQIDQTEEDNLISIRPRVAGKVSVQLQFAEVVPVESAGRLGIQVSVPPLPLATLRVLTEGQQDIAMRSIGPVQESMSDTFARIGPVDAIEFSWPAREDRSVLGSQPATLVADTWVHSSATGLAAACRLRIDGDIPSNRELQVVADASWVPVGNNWGEANWVSSTSVALGTQVVYTLKLQDRELAERSVQLRILMTPRSSERGSTLRIPFLSLQGSPVPERTLSWSSEEGTTWKPEGLSFWRQVDVTAPTTWGSLRFAGGPQLAYNSGREVGSLTLRKQPPSQPSIPTAAETTTVHLGRSELRIALEARITSSRPLGTYRLRVPTGARVSRILLDGQATSNYQVGSNALGQFVVLTSQAEVAGTHTLGIELTQRMRLGVLTALPRILLDGVSPASSTYTVLRGAGLDCELVGSEVALNSFEGASTMLLQNSEAPVGTIQLQSDYRDSVNLPLDFRLRQQPQTSRMRSLITVDHEAGSWMGKFSAMWTDLSRPLDVLCIQIPAQLRDEISMGQMPRRFVPTGDPNQLTMCLLPPAPVDGRLNIEFSFPLQSTATSQSLKIPDISVITSSPTSAVLALPKRLDGAPIRWSKVGKSKLDDPLLSVPKSHQVFESLNGQSQATWRVVDSTDVGAELLYSGLTLQSRMGDVISGVASYWIVPNGELDFRVEIPPGCQVVGVENGRSPVVWRQVDRQVSVLIQPNFLPLNLNLLLQWQYAGQADVELGLPRPMLTGNLPKNLVTNKLSGLQFAVAVGQSPPDAVLTPSTIQTDEQDDLPGLWASIVTSTLPTLRSMSGAEMEDWLMSWHPSSLEISSQAIVDFPAVLSPASDGSPPGRETVAYFWQSVCNLVGASEALAKLRYEEHPPGELALQDSDALQSILPDSMYLDGDRLTLTAKPQDDVLLARVTAACLLVVAAVLGLILIRRLGAQYTTVINHNPWIYWTQLALLTYLIIPVAWPAIVLLVLALSLLGSQWFDQRKRSRAILRV